jgi:hypothetical protein
MRTASALAASIIAPLRAADAEGIAMTDEVAIKLIQSLYDKLDAAARIIANAGGLIPSNQG